MSADYTFREMLPGVWYLGDPLGVNCTLVIGSERALLIDTGTGMGDLPGAVRELTELPLTVVNTHCHPDHMGGDFLFPEVWMPEGDLPIVPFELSEPIKNMIVDDIRRRKVPATEERIAQYLAVDGSNLRPLKGDEVFDLGGRTVYAVPLHGHTPGSTGFLCPELEVLFSGDAISPMTYLFFPESCTVSRHAALLERVKRDIPFRCVLSAHTDRLIPREELDLYLECARTVDDALSVPYRDPLFSIYKGALYARESSTHPGEFAMLVYDPRKEQEQST